VSCQQPVVDVDDIVNPSAVVLRISCNTLGGSPPGPSGNGLLVRVRLRNTGSGTTAITFSDDSGLSDPEGDEIPAAHLNDALVTTGAPTATSTPPGGVIGGIAAAAPPPDGGTRTDDEGGTAMPAPEGEHIALAILGIVVVAVLYRRRGTRAALAGTATVIAIAAASSMVVGGATAADDDARERSAAPQTLVVALAGDVNSDCRVNVIDEQSMAIRYLITNGMILYEPRFDIEPQGGDGDIDGKDLQVVLSHDGLDCSTDADGDGCTNAQEAGATPALGGGRDPYNAWDFYDVNASRKIDAMDIGMVRARFTGPNTTPPEDAQYDRSTGAASWAPGPPDGKINAVDVNLVRAAFTHDCR
jgi:hypothetical protein